MVAHKNQDAQDTQETSGGQCPLWHEDSGSCRFSQGGLLIPVGEHIRTYCTTPNHPSCSYFIQYQYGRGRKKQGGVENRRRYFRKSGIHSFRISEYSEDSGRRNLLDAHAQTIDLSPLGVRVQSNRALPVNARVWFSLNGIVSSVPITGQGLVVWCRCVETAQLYQAGIAVSDPILADQLRRKISIVDA